MKNAQSIERNWWHQTHDQNSTFLLLYKDNDDVID